MKQCEICGSTGKFYSMGGMHTKCPYCKGFGVIEDEVKTQHADVVKRDELLDEAVAILSKKTKGRPKKLQVAENAGVIDAV